MKRLSILIIAMGMMAQVVGADVWEDLAKYKMGDGTEPPLPVEVQAKIVTTPVDQMGTIEDSLIKIIESKESTPDSKWFSCRMLQRIGTDKCVPVLAALLCDEQMSHFARLTLERMKDSDQAGKALRDALEKASDKLKPGIMGSIAARRDEDAVKEIAKLISSSDSAVVKGALSSLGKIGGKKASKVLAKAEVAEDMQPVRLDAMLVCAESTGDSDVYEDIYSKEKSDTHRAAALRGLLITDEKDGCAIMSELVKGDDSYLRSAALRFVVMEQGERLTKAMTDVLGELCAAKQAELIILLGERGDCLAREAVTKFLTSEDKVLRESAITALGGIGDVGSVKLLLQQAASEEYKAQAIKGIAAMTDTGVNTVLIAALADNSLAVPAIQALALRGNPDAVPELIKLISFDNIEIRKGAWTGLSALASLQDVDGLIKKMLAISDAGEKGHAQGALKQLCSNIKDKNACINVFVPYYDSSDDSTKLFILDVAAVAGSSVGLKLTQQAIKSENQALYDKGVRALAAWSSMSAEKDLLDLAQNGKDDKTKIIAIRGYIQIVGRDERNEDKRVEKYQKIQALVQRADEKKLLIGGLGGIRRQSALKMLSEYVLDADVRIEAQRAAVDRANDFKDNKKDKDLVIEVMGKIMADTEADKNTAKRAKDINDHASNLQ